MTPGERQQIKALVDGFPPLIGEQRDRLSAILRAPRDEVPAGTGTCATTVDPPSPKNGSRVDGIA